MEKRPQSPTDRGVLPQPTQPVPPAQTADQLLREFFAPPVRNASVPEPLRSILNSFSAGVR